MRAASRCRTALHEISACDSEIAHRLALVQAIRLGPVRMCCSPALFLEHEDVLKRPSQLAASGLLASDVDAILNELAGLIEPVMTHYQWRPQLRNPADEMVLEAAVNAQADAIVTYNLRDFGPARSPETSRQAHCRCGRHHHEPLFCSGHCRKNQRHGNGHFFRTTRRPKPRGRCAIGLGQGGFRQRRATRHLEPG